MCGYAREQEATKTMKNAHQEGTQREPWIDEWGARHKTKKIKMLPLMFEK
jgi:hypothetical protein